MVDIKKGLVAIVVAVSFSAGVYYADDIKGLRAYSHHEAAKGFYHNPYGLRVEHSKSDGKVESYLVDAKTGKRHKIGRNMYVGNTKHRVNGIVDVTKEYAEEENNRTLKLLLGMYEQFFGDEE